MFVGSPEQNHPCNHLPEGIKSRYSSITSYSQVIHGSYCCHGRGGRGDFRFSKCEIPSLHSYNGTADWVNKHWASQAPAFRSGHGMCIFAHREVKHCVGACAQISLNDLWDAQKKSLCTSLNKLAWTFIYHFHFLCQSALGKEKKSKLLVFIMPQYGNTELWGCCPQHVSMHFLIRFVGLSIYTVLRVYYIGIKCKCWQKIGPKFLYTAV